MSCMLEMKIPMHVDSYDEQDTTRDYQMYGIKGGLIVESSSETM